MFHLGSRSRFPRAFSLVEILVVTVMLILLAGSLSYFYMGGKGKNGEKKKTPISVAKDTVCKSNIGQVRQSLQATQAGDPDGALPQSLTELKLPSEFYSCPVGKEPYPYDPTAGTVRCIHPGHENY